MKKHTRKILIYLLICLVIVIGSFSVLFFNFRKQLFLQDRIILIQNNLSHTDSIINNLLQLESDKRAFQITSDVSYLKQYYIIRSKCNRSLEWLRLNISSLKYSNAIRDIYGLMKTRLINMESGLKIFRESGAEAAILFMQGSDNRITRENLNKELSGLKNLINAELQLTTEAINRKSNQNIYGLLILVVVFLGIMLFGTRTFKIAQHRIIKNHLKFKEAQRIAKIGSWEWTFRNNKLKWSHEQYQIFGETRDEYEHIFQKYLDLFSFTEQERIISAFNYAIETRSEFIIEHDVVRKDGTRLTVLERGTLILDEHNNPIGMFGTTQDISERKKYEKQLLDAEIKYRSIIDNSSNGIYQSTIDGQFIMVNPSMAKIFGYSSCQEMIDCVKDIPNQIYADPADRQKMSNIIILKNQIRNYEFRALKKDGTIFWVSVNIRVIRNDNHSIKYYEGILEDITDRKKYEEELTNLSSRLQLALRATSIGIWDWDIQKNHTIWDQEMYRIYNVDSKDETKTVSEEWTAAVHPDDLEKVQEELRLAIEGVKDYDTVFRVIWKDKSIHYVTGNALVVRDSSGTAIRLIGTNSDITERKMAEQEILQLNKSLEQFANITAHDLQEPIRMVSGFLGLLEKKYLNTLDDTAKTYIFRAKDGADRMTILIRDLLEFSRSGNKSAKRESVNLKAVIDLVQKDMSLVINDTSAGLHFPSCLPVVEGTHSALYRLFLNLVSNGIKFSKKDISPDVSIILNEQTDSWLFTVQDNGIGVAENDQPKLFQAFHRLHRKEEYPGTGLGLVTCKKIVETHGGKIWMTSEHGKGTAFHFTLPKIRA